MVKRIAFLVLCISLSIIALGQNDFIEKNKKVQIIDSIYNKKCQVVRAQYIDNNDTINFFDKVSRDNFTFTFIKKENSDTIAFVCGHIPKVYLAGELFYLDTYLSKKRLTDVYKGKGFIIFKENVMKYTFYVSSFNENGKKLYSILIAYEDNSEMYIDFSE